MYTRLLSNTYLISPTCIKSVDEQNQSNFSIFLNHGEWKYMVRKTLKGSETQFLFHNRRTPNRVNGGRVGENCHKRRRSIATWDKRVHHWVKGITPVRRRCYPIRELLHNGHKKKKKETKQNKTKNNIRTKKCISFSFKIRSEGPFSKPKSSSGYRCRINWLFARESSIFWDIQH